MKRSILYQADVFGQLLVWILSLLPFIFFVKDLSKQADFYLLLLVHGLGLMIIGVWQLTSSLLNWLQAEGQQAAFFRQNLVIGIVLGLGFFIWVSVGSFRLSVKPGKEYTMYLCLGYFVLIDILCIRYWRYIYRYYSIKESWVKKQ